MERCRPKPNQKLTKRESQIFKILISTDAGYKEMSDKLFISERTFKYHASNIFIKKSVSGRLQLIFKEWAGPQ
jgi:DNA-binding CsgD family transcriptional regulator